MRCCVSSALLLDFRFPCAGSLRGKRNDVSGNTWIQPLEIGVEGQAKLGNYSVGFTDLSIPLAGIPIEITRTYDTLNAPFSGDFGFGWNLSIGEARIRETLPVTQAERDGVPALFGGAEPFFAGTRVYLTTPSGQRAGFTFDPVPEGGLLGTILRPRFVADPGVLETLEVEDIPLSQRSDGTFGLYLFGLPYNPREYTLTTKDGLSYRYDQFDELLDVTDRNGVKLTYTDAGIFSSTGESIQFVRDSRGRITEIIDPAGNSIRYTFDAAGDLRSVTDQVTNTTTMDYRSDVPHFLERITGPDGNLLNEVKYDEDNRFVALVDALGKEVQQEYDLDANTFIQTDRLGNPTTLIYDDRGNILQQTDPLDNTTFFEYSDPRNPHLETAVTDARGNTTRMTYDSRGNMTLLEQPGGIFTRFEYDQFNNITRTLGPSTVDPGDGDADTLVDSFFASGQILGAVVGERIANQDGELDVFETAEPILGPEFDRNTETPLESDYIVFQNPGDYVTVAFDETVIDRPGDDIFIITPFFAANFDPINSTAEVFVSTDGTTFQSVGLVGEAGYNPIDLADFGITDEVLQVRVVGVSSDDPNAVYGLTAIQVKTGDFRSTRNVYDQNGNLIEAIDALGNSEFRTVDPFGRVTSITDRGNFTTHFEYDQLIAAPTKVINPDGSFQTFVYNQFGQAISATDELENETKVDYNDIGLPILSVDVLGGETSFVYYDADGRPTSITDPNQNTTSYTYDTLGQLISETNELGDSRLFAYDAKGQLIEQVDRNGLIRRFEYDAVGHLTQEQWLDGSLIVRTIAFSYDSVGNLLTASDPDSTYAFTYDELNRLLTSDNTGTPDVPDLELMYSYDIAGNVVSIEDNFGVLVASEYDGRDLLTARTWQGGGVDSARVEFDYDERGLKVEVRRYADLDGNTQVGRSTYDSNDRGLLAELRHLDALDAVFAQYENEFDVAGRIIEEMANGEVTNFTYDDFSQLIAATRSNGNDENYSYDANGNRTNAGYVTGPDNRLLSDGTFDYEYDAEGNLIRKTEIATGNFTEYKYDHRNRLVIATNKSSGGIILSEVAFTYDVFDRRIAKIVDPDGAGPEPAETQIFLYDGQNTWADFDESGSVLARYLFGTEIDEIIARYRPSEGTVWYLTDRLGTIRDLADSTGALLNHITYDSFGNITGLTNPSVADRFAFTGREFEAETGLYYYRARFYNPQIGRFISQDPIRFAAGDANFYRYADNAVTNVIDPAGTTTIKEYKITIGRRTFSVALHGGHHPYRVFGKTIFCIHIQLLSYISRAAGGVPGNRIRIQIPLPWCRGTSFPRF